MMNTLLILHLLITIALVGTVLIQRSEGGGTGLGGGGGGGAGGGFMTTRGSANTLTRMTVILATMFFASSILLSIVAGAQRGSSGSVLDSVDNLPAPSPIELPVEGDEGGLPAVPTGD